MNDEGGYAVLEAFLVGLILMVPLVWMLTVASTLHRTALASSSAAREAGLIAARAVTAAEADRKARAAVARALSEQGIDPDSSIVSLSWVSDRRATVGVEVEVPVRVLTIPFVGRPSGPMILVRASHVAHTDPYRSLDG